MIYHSVVQNENHSVLRPCVNPRLISEASRRTSDGGDNHPPEKPCSRFEESQKSYGASLMHGDGLGERYGFLCESNDVLNAATHTMPPWRKNEPASPKNRSVDSWIGRCWYFISFVCVYCPVFVVDARETFREALAHRSSTPAALDPTSTTLGQRDEARSRRASPSCPSSTGGTLSHPRLSNTAETQPEPPAVASSLDGARGRNSVAAAAEGAPATASPRKDFRSNDGDHITAPSTSIPPPTSDSAAAAVSPSLPAEGSLIRPCPSEEEPVRQEKEEEGGEEEKKGTVREVPRAEVLRVLRRQGSLRRTAMASDAIRPILTDRNFTKVCPHPVASRIIFAAPIVARADAAMAERKQIQQRSSSPPGKHEATFNVFAGHGNKGRGGRSIFANTIYTMWHCPLFLLSPCCRHSCFTRRRRKR